MHFAIDRCRRRDDAAVGIDVKQSVGITGEAIGNGVVGRIQVEGVGRNAHRRADANILRDFVGRGIAVGGHADVEFIDVDDGDVERLAGYRTITAGRFDGDRTGGSVHFAIDRGRCA